MSTAETETTLQRMATVTNVAEGGEVKQSAVRMLRYNERQAREDALKEVGEHLAAPAWTASAMTPEGRRALAMRKRAITKDLEANSPRDDLSAETRDALYQRSQMLEASIVQGMPTREEMRRNPVGAVDKHRRWDRAHKAKVLEWKNIQIQLQPESDEIDLANVERLRPSQLDPAGASTYMANAQIPGVFAMTPQAKANWPLGDPTIQTATSHVLKSCPLCDNAYVEVGEKLCADCLASLIREYAPIPKWTPGGTKAKRTPPTPEQRRLWGEKIRAAKAAKAAEREVEG